MQESVKFARYCKDIILNQLSRSGFAGKLYTPILLPRRLILPFRLVNVQSDRVKELIRQTEVLEHLIGDPVTVFKSSGKISFSVQLPEELWQTITVDDLKSPLSIGVSVGGRMVELDIHTKGPDFHMLVVGSPGSGKSNLIKAIILTFARALTANDLVLGVVDPHGSLDIPIKLPHLFRSVANNEEQVTALLESFLAELENRKALGEAVVSSRDLPEWLLVVDEVSASQVFGSGRFQNLQHLEIVRRLVQEGRKFGMRVILGVQKPTEANLPGILSNMPHRMVGLASGSKMASHLSGRKEVPAHKLSGQGEFFQVSGGGVRQFVSVLIREKDWDLVNRQNRTVKLADNRIIGYEVPKTKRGRPQKRLDPEIVAWYIKNLPDVSPSLAEKTWDLSRYIHVKYLEFAKSLQDGLET